MNETHLSTDHPAQKAFPAAPGPEDLYRAVIGPRAVLHYLPRFLDFDARGKSGLGWHWPAFFITFYWLAYRRMGLNAFIYFVLPYVVMLALPLSVMLLGFFSETLAGAGLIVGWVGFTLALFVVPPLYGDALYYRHCRAKIAKAQRLFSDPQQQLDWLRRKGGTSAVLLVLVGIVFVAVMAAVAIPAYQSYTERARQAMQPLPAPASGPSVGI
ncbi:DUF2628 domain-containing protein [Amphibiibacter pelophylacis]|uniref:DUF2628 domain-containing protein n=1 Tax=Amphibiibacter pelophylacis TaxID=1799477 RepID=A0ACC6P5N0_9BURK